jgi:alpha-mannosidase
VPVGGRKGKSFCTIGESTMSGRRITFHLIGNAHLDPVWLWDWREGLNEGLITTRTLLDLLDEEPELTVIRGEASIYEHIERTDPATFERIRRHARGGRWEVVGGTYVQPDTNLPATETFARHFLRGQRYFASRFGRPVRVAWAADSFGHAAGLPEILAQAGIEGFCFTRPNQRLLPLAKPAFWWEGPGGARVLACRSIYSSYTMERDGMLKKLDGVLEAAKSCDLRHYAVFYGLGNHGGGPTRRHIAEIREWRARHPEVEVLFSGLHQLIDALRDEARARGPEHLPTHSGEMNFCLRGCYASVARFKYFYRRTEAQLCRAEKTAAAVSMLAGAPAPDLGRAWDAVLFNSFHDILPGSSIERAYDDQSAWMGLALHEAQRAELDALNALALRMDTRVTKPGSADEPTPLPVLAWNPHPTPFKGFVEIETSLDYRPLYALKDRCEGGIRLIGPGGESLPFQVIATESHCIAAAPWRRRIVAPMELPPMGWKVLQFGWAPEVRRAARRGGGARSPRAGVIANEHYRVEARPGAKGVRILRDGKPVLRGEGLTAVLFDDPYGSWGGMGEERASTHLDKARETWRIAGVETIESGPERAALWVRLAGRRSWIELTFQLCRGRDAVDVVAHALLNERAARLKLVMPAGDRAEFDVPGAAVRRGPCGEVPGGRWARVTGPAGEFGFASDALYSFDCVRGRFRATVARASRYGSTATHDARKMPWQRAVDLGELNFRFLISPGGDALPRLAAELEQPPLCQVVAPRPGALPRAGSVLALAPEGLRLLAFKPAAEGGGFVLRAQNTLSRPVTPKLTLMGRNVVLPRVAPWRIATWRLERRRGGWVAETVTLQETPA